jgi:hypothetical protein
VRGAWLLSAAAGALALPAPLFAQSPAGGEVPPPGATQATRTTVYDSAFFQTFAPRTALDIARRIPGFALDLGNTNVRGFAQAAGNVVINGARPSSKSDSLETILARIPADRVTRVEVGPGDLYGAEYSSKSQVLNVILSAEGGLDGTATGSVRRLYTGKIVPDGSVSALIRRGAASINLAAGTANVLNHEEGTDTIVELPSGELVEFRRKFNSYHDFNPYVSGSWALERGDNDAFRVNARWSPGQFDLYQRNRVSPADRPQHDDSLIQDYDNPVFELGGDVTRPLAGGAIKLVGLATRRKRNYFDAYTERNGLLEDNPDVVGGFEQTQKARLNETIGRLTWSRQNLAGLSVEAGGEAVLNTLDSNVELFEIDEDGSRKRVNLPIDNARVKEKRGEAFVNVGKTVSPALRVDGGVTYEYSHLTVSGDATANRKLKFIKPNLTLDWKPGGGWHTQLSLRRTVAQLNFYDFISVAELSNDRVNAGNANLQPQRAWELRGTVEKPILGDGLFKIDVGHDLISMLQDRILIFDEDGKAFDAPGNLGTGKRSFVDVTLDAPLTRFGLTGARLKVTGELQRTRVEDPISGKMRNFSDFYPNWNWSVDFRHDLGAISYGFVVQDRAPFTFFRTDEFDINWNDGPYATAFVEYRPGPRTAITFDIDNAINTRAVRDRLLFDPNRAHPNRMFDEFRERNRHLNLGITIKQSFGSAAKKVSAEPSAPAG